MKKFPVAAVFSEFGIILCVFAGLPLLLYQTGLPYFVFVITTALLLWGSTHLLARFFRTEPALFTLGALSTLVIVGAVLLLLVRESAQLHSKGFSYDEIGIMWILPLGIGFYLLKFPLFSREDLAPLHKDTRTTLLAAWFMGLLCAVFAILALHRWQETWPLVLGGAAFAAFLVPPAYAFLVKKFKIGRVFTAAMRLLLAFVLVLLLLGVDLLIHMKVRELVWLLAVLGATFLFFRSGKFRGK